MTGSHAGQARSASLIPLERALADLRAAIRPVAPQMMPPHQARGCVLAAPIQVAGPVPPEAIALRDGWAVAASDVVGASSYSPIFPAAPPPWIETGQVLPMGTDSVLPPDGFSARNGLPEIIAAIAPGEGVRYAGGDVAAGAVLREAGERVRPADVALALAAGIDRISVRQARVQILSLPGPAILDATGELVANLVEAAGGVPERVHLPSRDGASIGAAVRRQDGNLMVVIGGTGFGREDHAAEALAGAGSVMAHGIALRPGETAGCGVVGTTPIMLVPGRLEAALATMLALGLPCLDHLMGAAPGRPLQSGRLTRKISSQVGVTEIVLLRRHGQGIEPLAVGDLTLAAIAAAEAWLAVPAESEGFARGDTVAAFLL
jgi:molybdopterin biosynthesis enzyme